MREQVRVNKQAKFVAMTLKCLNSLIVWCDDVEKADSSDFAVDVEKKFTHERKAWQMCHDSDMLLFIQKN